jgi:hypothetical protein
LLWAIQPAGVEKEKAARPIPVAMPEPGRSAVDLTKVLAGYKTYIATGIAAVAAFQQFTAGNTPGTLQALATALGLVGLRAALARVEPYLAVAMQVLQMLQQVNPPVPPEKPS